MKNRVIKGVIFTVGFTVVTWMVGCCDLTVEEKESSNNVNIDEVIEKEVVLTINKVDENNKRINELQEIINNPYMILVNRENKVSEQYIPIELVATEIEFLDYIETREMEAQAAEAIKEMFDDALNGGIELLGASGYRSYSVQKNMYDSRVASMGQERTSRYTAEPGASEHQSGLAIDILGRDYQFLDDGFEKSESFKWLRDNCYKYGFILRYLKEKEDITGYNYEPWHFRYIGNEVIAKEIMDNNITLEEYLDEVKKEISYIREEMK